MVIDKKARRVICTRQTKGKTHDFELFKQSRLRLSEQTKCLGDAGYQGLEKEHENSQTPIKKPKGGELSKEQRQANRELAKKRIVVENVIRYLKIFRIVTERYRNRRRRFGLRFNLIAGLYNFELNH